MARIAPLEQSWYHKNLFNHYTRSVCHKKSSQIPLIHDYFCWH
jgi:hypothetical protein